MPPPPKCSRGIAEYRGMSAADMPDRTGRGAILTAEQAVAAGLFDRVAGPGDAWLSVGGPPPSSVLVAGAARMGARHTAARPRTSTGGTRMTVQTQRTAEGDHILAAADYDALTAAAAERDTLLALVEQAERATAAAKAEADAKGEALEQVAGRVEALEAAAKARAEADRKAAIAGAIDGAIRAGKLAHGQRDRWVARGDQIGLEVLAGILQDLPASRPTEARGYGQERTRDAGPSAADDIALARDAQALAAEKHITIPQALAILRGQEVGA